MKTCPKCHGKPLPNETHLCPGCGGKGEVNKYHGLLPTDSLTLPPPEFVTCTLCRGTGLIEYKPRCGLCLGVGLVPDNTFSW